MRTTEVKLKDTFIKLGQALKAAGIAQSGVDAKYMIQDGKVLVNGVREMQRGKKLYNGDEIVCGDLTIRITADEESEEQPAGKSEEEPEETSDGNAAETPEKMPEENPDEKQDG